MSGGHPGHLASFFSPSDAASKLQPCIDNLKKPPGQQDADPAECAATVERGVQELVNHAQGNAP